MPARTVQHRPISDEELALDLDSHGVRPHRPARVGSSRTQRAQETRDQANHRTRRPPRDDSRIAILALLGAPARRGLQQHPEPQPEPDRHRRPRAATSLGAPSSAAPSAIVRGRPARRPTSAPRADRGAARRAVADPTSSSRTRAARAVPAPGRAGDCARRRRRGGPAVDPGHGPAPARRWHRAARRVLPPVRELVRPGRAAAAPLPPGPRRPTRSTSGAWPWLRPTSSRRATARACRPACRRPTGSPDGCESGRER